MEEDTEKEIYKEAQLISFIIVLALCNFNLILGIIPGLLFIIYVYFMAGVPARKMSKLIIRLGNKIKSKSLRVLYYVLFLPGFLFLLSWGICILVNKIYSPFAKPDIYGSYMGAAFIWLFLCIVAIIPICIPYLETLVVFLIKKVKFNNSEGKN